MYFSKVSELCILTTVSVLQVVRNLRHVHQGTSCLVQDVCLVLILIESFLRAILLHPLAMMPVVDF